MTQLEYPSVEHWLSLMPESKRKQIMKIVDTVQHECFNCYWFTFAKGSQNRGCHYPDKLKIAWVVPEAGIGDCCNWRLDPNYKNRVRGVQGFIR